ncbi:MAG: biotin/lipoate A/B protein ligase family protein [Halobacteriaceae archaeon]
MAEWRLIREEARPGAVQMALEEVAVRAAASGIGTVRVYRWAPPALSLGYAQDPATVDWDAAADRGVDVVRRQTGGGAIYHDGRGDISYSVVAPAGAFGGPRAAYRACCTPVLDALAALGADAGFADERVPTRHAPACYLRELDPAHDVVAGGKKVGGNAQYRRRDATVQHGSLVYDLDAGRHAALFADPPPADAFDERVTSLRAEAGAARAEAVAALERALAEWAGATEEAWTDAELRAARELADHKYRDPAWTRNSEAPDGADEVIGKLT